MNAASTHPRIRLCALTEWLRPAVELLALLALGEILIWDDSHWGLSQLATPLIALFLLLHTCCMLRSESDPLALSHKSTHSSPFRWLPHWYASSTRVPAILSLVIHSLLLIAIAIQCTPATILILALATSVLGGTAQSYSLTRRGSSDLFTLALQFLLVGGLLIACAEVGYVQIAGGEDVEPNVLFWMISLICVFSMACLRLLVCASVAWSDRVVRLGVALLSAAMVATGVWHGTDIWADARWTDGTPASLLSPLPHASVPALLGMLLLMLRAPSAASEASPSARWPSIVVLCAILVFGAVTIESVRRELSRPHCTLVDAGYPLPSHLVVHLLSAEDPIFMRHHGVDSLRITRAIRETFKRGEFGRGGSTLSMQLAKVCFLTSDRSLFRKIKQMLIGSWLEIAFGKKKILFSYLESVPFSSTTVGLRDAAREFYNKKPSELSMIQGLTLVQSIFDPEHFNPTVTSPSLTVLNRRAAIRGLAQRYCATLQHDLHPIGEISWSSPACRELRRTSR